MVELVISADLVRMNPTIIQGRTCAAFYSALNRPDDQSKSLLIELAYNAHACWIRKTVAW
jgi:hypothetical protein